MTTTGSRSILTGDRIHAWVIGIGVGAIAAYWAEFITSGRVKTSEDEAYLDFEKAFLLADAYLACTALLAARFLSQGRPEAVATGIAAGSAVTFLGLMDLAYNLQHHKFSDRTPEMALEGGIVASSLVSGPFTMLRLWRARKRLGT
jgi:hypothetical protein